MISALNDGRPSRARPRAGCGAGSASAGRTGAAATRARAAARGRSRAGMRLLLSGHLLADLDDAGDRARRRSARRSRRRARVASPTTPDARDVAEHVHRHDHARARSRACRSGRTTSTAGPRPCTAAPRSQASRVARSSSTRWPSASASEVSASSAWIIGPSISASTSDGEIPPLDEEDAAAGRLEVVVDGDGQRGDVAAVPVHGDEVLEAVVDERVADLAEDLEERRRREAHRARELHVVPGERHVQRRRDEELDALLLAEPPPPARRASGR